MEWEDRERERSKVSSDTGLRWEVGACVRAAWYLPYMVLSAQKALGGTHSASALSTPTNCNQRHLADSGSQAAPLAVPRMGRGAVSPWKTIRGIYRLSGVISHEGYWPGQEASIPLSSLHPASVHSWQTFCRPWRSCDIVLLLEALPRLSFPKAHAPVLPSWVCFPNLPPRRSGSIGAVMPGRLSAMMPLCMHGCVWLRA